LLNSALVSSSLIVWRETFEAMLILFLIWTGLKKQGLWDRSKKYVYSAILTGIFLSGIFAAVVLFFSEMGEASGVQFVQAIAPLIAAGLMVHMVLWMSAHAREVSGEIKELIHSKKSWALTWGIFGIVVYSLSREGFETVVYLYGMSLNPINKDLHVLHYLAVFAIGTGLSLLTMYAFKNCMAFFSLKMFFKVTNLFLLATAASLVVVGINKLIELEYLPSVIDPVWNTSHILDGQSKLGQILNLLFGYNPQPSLTLVLAYMAFWMGSIFLLQRQRGRV
jgi:high-affinity iron transporter